MKKFIGWVLFFGALGVVRVFQTSASTPGEANPYIVAGWVIFGLLCLFGWYMLAIRRDKSHDKTRAEYLERRARHSKEVSKQQ